MDREVLVYVDLQGTPRLVGRLWARLRKDRESATFEYDKNWLAHSESHPNDNHHQSGAVGLRKHSEHN